jgi:hypothetical protein
MMTTGPQNFGSLVLTQDQAWSRVVEPQSRLTCSLTWLPLAGSGRTSSYRASPGPSRTCQCGPHSHRVTIRLRRCCVSPLSQPPQLLAVCTLARWPGVGVFDAQKATQQYRLPGLYLPSSS